MQPHARRTRKMCGSERARRSVRVWQGTCQAPLPRVTPWGPGVTEHWRQRALTIAPPTSRGAVVGGRVVGRADLQEGQDGHQPPLHHEGRRELQGAVPQTQGLQGGHAPCGRAEPSAPPSVGTGPSGQPGPQHAPGSGAKGHDRCLGSASKKKKSLQRRGVLRMKTMEVIKLNTEMEAATAALW